jgi:hypothetical protein
MKIKLEYIGWFQPEKMTNVINNWLEENSDVMIQGIEHKTRRDSGDMLTIITYVEGALDAQQPQGDPVPEDMG